MRIVWHAIWRIGLWGLGMGALLGGVYGTFIALLLGTVFGVLFGGAVGGPLGLADGLIIGLMTRLFFKPPLDAHRYQWTAVVVSTLFSGAGAIIGFEVLFNFSDDSQTMLIAVLLPSIVAGCAMGFGARRFARWYEAEYLWESAQKKKKREVQAES